MAFKRDAALQAAERQMARGKYEAALKEYERILADNPRDILALNKIGDIFVLLNRARESIPYFNRIAEHYARDGFFLKAIAIYKKINKLDPSRLEIYSLLADLYSKQGLLPEARAQYQILADHHLKHGQAGAAIEVLRRLSAVDPNDIKSAVKLADLLTNEGRTDEALDQYGVVGEMLAKRGALDEAVSVFQKALRVGRDERRTLERFSRSLLESGHAETAARLLKGQKRNSTTMGLLAEALTATGQLDEALQAAEAALAFDEHQDDARRLAVTLFLRRGEPLKAFEAVRGTVDLALTNGNLGAAASWLEMLGRGADTPKPVLAKLVEVRRRAGDSAQTVAALRNLASACERDADAKAAAQAYRDILEILPNDYESRARLGAAPPPAEAEPESPAQPRPSRESRSSTEIEVEFDEKLIAETGPVHRKEFPRPASSPAIPLDLGEVPAAPPPEEQWKEARLEAEVFAKYGLVEKAMEKYRSLVRRQPEDLSVRHRYVELLGELKAPALAAEARRLSSAYRAAGRSAEADAVASRFEAGSALVPPASPPQTGPPRLTDVSASLDLDVLSTLSLPKPAPPGPPPTDDDLPVDSGLGQALENQMALAHDRGEPFESPSAAAPVDESTLFSDEQEFFDLAAELEKELEDEEANPRAPSFEGLTEEVSLEQIFREFKKGVEQQLSPEDFETHYNLGIAYKEMGLLDEAIGEFQISAKDPARAVECCSMLGICFREKGLPQLAVEWFGRGIASPGISPEESLGLRYDLAEVYEQIGDESSARRTFLEIYGENANYRDVAERLGDAGDPGRR